MKIRYPPPLTRPTRGGGMIPGDPVEQKLANLTATGGGDINIAEIAEVYRKKFGLDQPVWKQYLSYWGDIFRWDLGYSLANYPQTVSEVISAGLPWTIGLVGVATLLSFIIGSFLGAVLAWPKTPTIIKGLSIPLMILSTIPYLLLGIILVFFLAIKKRYFPAGGGYTFGMILDWDWETIKNIVHHAFLPAISVVAAGIGRWALGMRGMMVGTLRDLGTSIILIGHDMGLMAQFVDRLTVMYAGRIVEISPVRDIFKNPLHPYTQLLVKSIPRPDPELAWGDAEDNVIAEEDLSGAGCPFAPRCPNVMELCRKEKLPLFRLSEKSAAACFLYKTHPQCADMSALLEK